MAESNKDTQVRFLLAVMLSMAILFGWSYLFPGPEPDPNEANANVAQVENANVSENKAPEAKTEEPKKEETETAEAEDTPDDTPNKKITVKTPLYEATIDSKGAVATSWILKKNVSSEDREGKPLFASGSNGEIQEPLELIDQEGLSREPREVPFVLSTGDENLNKLINQKNYRVSVEQESFELNGEESQKIDFVYTNEANKVEITKSFTFYADSYLTDLSVKLTKDGQPVPNTKLLIGASIADQAVNYYNFYQVQPEGVAFANGDTERIYSSYVVDDANEGVVAGNVDWAGVGDTYFAMAAIPAQPVQGVVYTASKYEVEIDPVFSSIFQWVLRNPETKQDRYLISAYIPIPTDGATNLIYTGTKDSFVLSEYNQIISDRIGRPIDIEEFINYGWLGFFVKPLSYPILLALNFLYGFTSNYGWAIIIFTIFFYSLLFPLRWYQSKSFKKSASNAPKMKELQEKMKEMQKKGVPQDDPKMRELQMQQLRMTKDALPIGGCLPMLLQFPFLIALYYTVSIALGFRQAEFLWLPDLSAGDPYHLLEFGFAFSMVLSMKFSPTAAPTTPEQQMQQKLMTYFMPIMMLWIMWSAPSGLLLYWFIGNIIMFGQQMVINHMNKTDEPIEEEKEKDTPPVVMTKKQKKNKRKKKKLP